MPINSDKPHLWKADVAQSIDFYFAPGTEIYLGKVTVDDFRKNPRGKLGTRTATLHKRFTVRKKTVWGT